MNKFFDVRLQIAPMLDGRVSSIWALVVEFLKVRILGCELEVKQPNVIQQAAIAFPPSHPYKRSNLLSPQSTKYLVENSRNSPDSLQ
jgi:hypothetical protein